MNIIAVYHLKSTNGVKRKIRKINNGQQRAIGRQLSDISRRPTRILRDENCLMIQILSFKSSYRYSGLNPENIHEYTRRILNNLWKWGGTFYEKYVQLSFEYANCWSDRRTYRFDRLPVSKNLSNDTPLHLTGILFFRRWERCGVCNGSGWQAPPAIPSGEMGAQWYLGLCQQSTPASMILRRAHAPSPSWQTQVPFAVGYDGHPLGGWPGQERWV